MTFEEIVQAVRMLSAEDKKQVVIAILDSFIEEQRARTHRIEESRGSGSHLRDVDEARGEGEDCP